MAEEITEGITGEGLTLLSYNEILQEIQDDLTSIYAQDGDPINFGSETPDGQFTNILAQLFSDNRELVREVYNSFNPDNCSGAVQDTRYALNYIERKQGTFTIQNIDVKVTQPVTLQGLDANYNDVNATAYTVSDDSGQLWFLIDSFKPEEGVTYPKTYSLPFRSQNYGLYSPTINSITNQVNIVIGVESVTNSVAPTTLGENQETDGEFKVRRTRSTATHGQNNLDALQAYILNLSGVTDAYIHNNATNSTDATGTAANTVWIIVEGGANSDIGAAIYQYSCGKPTRGSVSVNMQSLSGETFPTSFDRANPVPLYIRFNYQSLETVGADFLTALKQYIASNLTYVLNETAESSKISEIARFAVSSNGGTGYPLDVEISTDNTNWTDLIQSTSLKNKFVVDATRIFITDTLI